MRFLIREFKPQIHVIYPARELQRFKNHLCYVAYLHHSTHNIYHTKRNFKSNSYTGNYIIFKEKNPCLERDVKLEKWTPWWRFMEGGGLIRYQSLYYSVWLNILKNNDSWEYANKYILGVYETRSSWVLVIDDNFNFFIENFSKIHQVTFITKAFCSDTNHCFIESSNMRSLLIMI